MSPERALQLALNFLKPFQEAGNIFDDYQRRDRNRRLVAQQSSHFNKVFLVA